MSYLTAHPDYKGKLFVSRIKMPREYWFPINVQFVDYFDKKHFAALEYKYTEIDDETHSTMVFPGTYFGLRDIFSDYRMEMNEKVTEQSILSYYNALFAKYGYPVKMPEQVINRLWVMMMEEKNYQKAMIYGESRIKTYPKSSRAYMDLGSTYVQTGNKEMATKLLTKSLEIDPNNDEAKQMLNSLTGK